MPLLLTATDFAPYRELSPNIDDATRLNPYIAQAQQFDLKPLLGELFYQNLTDNPATTENALLLSGGSYTYNGNTYCFAGLKAALVFYAYSRFIDNQNVNITRFGVVYKNNPEVSERVDEKTLQRLVLQARDQAMGYWIECEQFLKRNPSQYPLWKGHVNQPKAFTISAIG